MKLALLPVLIVILVMAGCSTVTGDETYETVTLTAKVQLPPEVTTAEPTKAVETGNLEPIIEPVNDPVNTFMVYSPKLIIGNLPTGGHIDGVCINIENRYLEPITVNVYLDRYGGESYSENNNKYYQPAPDGYEDFISIHHWGEYVIPEWSILTLPIEIDIPNDVSDIPESWEFHIKASMGAGNVLSTRIQRWLITMR